MTERRLTLQDAAQELGISPDALRQRIRRGQYHSTKEDGRVYVYLNLDRTQTERDVQDEPTKLISALEERIASLERQLEQATERDRENRRLLAAALERIPPQLEAPQEPQESPETVEEGPERSQPRPDAPDSQEGVRRPWWRRVFGA
jgi:DNA-binding transcriptional MerR regulator